MRVVTMWSFENRTIYIYICQIGWTPLHLAAARGLEECVKIMLQLPDIAAVVRMQDEVSLKEVICIHIHISRHNIFSISIVEMQDCFS